MSPTPLTFMFKDDGKVPNNPALPALVYKDAVDFSGMIPRARSKACSRRTAGATANGATASIRSCTITR